VPCRTEGSKRESSRPRIHIVDGLRRDNKKIKKAISNKRGEGGNNAGRKDLKMRKGNRKALPYPTTPDELKLISVFKDMGEEPDHGIGRWSKEGE